MHSDALRWHAIRCQSDAIGGPRHPDIPTSRLPDPSPQRHQVLSDALAVIGGCHQRYSAPLSGRTANGSPQISQRSHPRVARCIGLATARASWRATRSPRRCTCRSSPHKDRASCRARGSVRGRRHQSSSVVISRHQSSSVVISRHQSASVVIRRHQSSSVVISRHQASSGVIRRHQSSSGVIRRHPSSSVVISRHQSSSVVIRRHHASSRVIRRHPSPSVALTCPRKAYRRMQGTIAAAHATTSDELATSFRKST
jgi:hypothetical protein